MQLLPGCKLVDAMKRYGQQQAAIEGKTLQQFEDEIKDQIEREGVVARYDGPGARKIQTYLTVMRARDKALNVGVWLYNTCLWKSVPYYATAMPPNSPR